VICWELHASQIPEYTVVLASCIEILHSGSCTRMQIISQTASHCLVLLGIAMMVSGVDAWFFRFCYCMLFSTALGLEAAMLVPKVL